MDHYSDELLDDALLNESERLKGALSLDALERAAAMNVIAARAALGLPPLYDPGFMFNRDKWIAGGYKPSTKLDPIPGDPCPQCWAAALVDPEPKDGPIYSPRGDADWAEFRFEVLCPRCQWKAEGRDYYRVDLDKGGSEYRRAFKTRPIATDSRTEGEKARDIQEHVLAAATKAGYRPGSTNSDSPRPSRSGPASLTIMEFISVAIGLAALVWAIASFWLKA